MQRPDPCPDDAFLLERARARKDLSAGIEDQIKALHVLDPRKRLAEFAFFGLLYGIGATSTSAFQGMLPIQLGGILLMGLALNSLPIFIHEGLHRLLSRDPRANHLLSFLVGLPILVSATAYSTTHSNHHHRLGRKPDYGTYRQHTAKPGFVWIAYFLQLLAGSLLYIALIPLLAFRASAPGSRAFIVVEYLVIALVWTLVFAFVPSTVILVYWFLPLLVLNVLTNIRGLASHALGDPEDLYISSRTVKSSGWASFLFLHENYHLEHHLFPGTPSYHLPRLHSLLWPRLPRALWSESYLHFLRDFLEAALARDLEPMGVVVPGRSTPPR